MDEAFSVAAKYQADLQIQRRKNVLQEKQLMCHQGKLKNNESNVADLENEYVGKFISLLDYLFMKMHSFHADFA